MIKAATLIAVTASALKLKTKCDPFTSATGCSTFSHAFQAQMSHLHGTAETHPTETHCAPGCPLGWKGDHECDEACNNAACNFDMGDCGNHHDASVAHASVAPLFHHFASLFSGHMGLVGTWTCGPAMDHYCVADGVAGPEPSTASGHWTAEPQTCAPGCHHGWQGDNYCDDACNNTACNFDDGDCGTHHDASVAPEEHHEGPIGTWSCGPTMDHYCVAAGVAGPEPSTASGHWTAEPQTCAPGCHHGWQGDNYCDNACNNAACYFDDGDCGTHHDASVAPEEHHEGPIGTWSCGPTMDHYCVAAGVAGPEPSTASGHWTAEPQTCAPGCHHGWQGDNYCDDACMNAACNFDDGDCGTH